MTRPVSLADIIRLLHHRQDLMLAVSIIAGVNVAMAFTPSNLTAYLGAAGAGVALWVATVQIARRSERIDPTRIYWRAVPTYVSLTTFTLRLAVDHDRPYALWVVGTLEVLYIVRMVYRAIARIARSVDKADANVTAEAAGAVRRIA